MYATFQGNNCLEYAIRSVCFMDTSMIVDNPCDNLKLHLADWVVNYIIPPHIDWVLKGCFISTVISCLLIN